ncbi:MAG: hypothetical protein K9I99_04130 [Melioribacteraceae bacterium]|nr:hypothetical protein [Melioribacteraceae bacterium]MCF8431080.1 hypothetical protein [Melioribacteraceae bacterium]
MKKFLFVLFVLCLSFSTQAQHFSGRFSSSLYSFERFTDKQNSETNLRSFQTLYFNLGNKDYSLKSRLNLETNLMNSLDNDPRLRFYNLYVEARNIFDIATVKLGRQTLFNSAAGGLFDGLSFKANYSMFKFEGYFGGNVPAYQKLAIIDNFGDNYLLGGKISAYPLEKVKVAVSYINKNYKPQDYLANRLDALNNPITLLIEQNSNQFEFVSAEASYFDDKFLTVFSKIEYDLNFATASKFEVSGRYSQIDDLGVSFYYNFREPRIRYNSIFSVFNYGSTQEIEGGLDYRLTPEIQLMTKFGNVTYEDDDAQRYTLGFNTIYGNISYRVSTGYTGELNSLSAYTAKSFMDGMITPSVGVSFTGYKLSKDEEEKSITSVLAGMNYRPMRNLSFDLQGQFFNNPIYSNDFRVLFKVNHWFNTNF